MMPEPGHYDLGADVLAPGSSEALRWLDQHRAFYRYLHRKGDLFERRPALAAMTGLALDGAGALTGRILDDDPDELPTRWALVLAGSALETVRRRIERATAMKAG